MELKKAHTFGAIVVNYLVAAVTGFLLIPKGFFTQNETGYIPIAIFIGVLFIIMLYLIGVSTQKAGISITTLSGRLAVVIPILFSIIYFNEKITIYKIVALILAIASLFLILYRKEKENIARSYRFLPVIIFFGAGFIDSSIKYAQAVYLRGNSLPAFTVVLFSISFLIGFAISIMKRNGVKDIFTKWTLILGTGLGIANFGTLYFFVNALNKSRFSSPVAFGINHIGIVMFTVVVAWLFFREKLNLFNKIGVGLAIIALAILSLK